MLRRAGSAKLCAVEDSAAPLDRQSELGPEARVLEVALAPTPWSWRRRVLVIAMAALLLPAGAYLYWVAFEHRVYALSEGALYRAAEIPPAELVDVARELGLRAVVDFRAAGPAVEAERAALRAVGVEHLHLAVDDLPSRESVRAFLSATSDASLRPLLFHGGQGEHHAGVFAAIGRVSVQNWHVDEAIREARLLSGLGKFGSGTPEEVFLRRYSQQLEQVSANALSN